MDVTASAMKWPLLGFMKNLPLIATHALWYTNSYNFQLREAYQITDEKIDAQYTSLRQSR
jgi:hypothetical protein